MKNDEFNSLKITNDSVTSKREFGHTPKTEYTFEHDNIINIKDSANRTDTLNDQIKGNAELGTADHYDKDKTEKLQNSTESSSQASSGTSSTSSVASSAASSSASSAASVPATVATAASVVAVATVSAAAGVSIITNQNAICRMLDFSIFTNRVEYALVIENSEEENFAIFVDNTSYAGKHPLHSGENFGEFVDLDTNTTYSIVVKEDKFGGKVLFDEYFTTKSTSEFNGVYFDGRINYDDGSFEVKLDFYDEDNIYTDFIFSLEGISQRGDSRRSYLNADNVYTFNLEKTTEPQTLYAGENNEHKQMNYREGIFAYSVSYKEKGQEIQTEPTEFHFEPKEEPQPVEIYHDITWVDGNGYTIKTDSVLEGSIPQYVGDDPTKDSTETTVYSFVGWEEEIAEAYEDATYHAKFEESPRLYTIKWVDDEGKLLKEEEYEYNSTPSYGDTNPTKTSEEYEYTFVGWKEEIVPVTGDATYTAVFESKRKVFTISWVDEDGNSLGTSSVEYGVEPKFEGELPTEDERYNYEFMGWNPEVTIATEDTTYTAIFEKYEKTFTITWLDYNDEVLDVFEDVSYGAEVQFTGEVPSIPVEEGVLVWTGEWDKEIVSVTSDATYKAQYKLDESVQTYNISWYVDNELVSTTIVEEGDIPSFGEKDPVKAPDEQYTFVFVGWTPDIVEATEDASYYAEFRAVTRTYTVSWIDEDGTPLYSLDDVTYGQEVHYDGQDPTKESTAQYDYEFAGWDPEEGVIEGDTTYTATYEEITRSYTITWNNYDGETLLAEEYEFGAIPQYPNGNPTYSDEQYEYEFIGWSPEISEVSEDTTYTANYSQTDKQYTITFYDADGEVFFEQDFAYGEKPYCDNTPSKDSDEEFDYEFLGWAEEQAATEPLDELPTVTGEAVYYPVFASSDRMYTITWVNYDGTTLLTQDYTYGSEPEYTGETPTKPETDEATFEFSDWDPEIGEVNGDKTYTAMFNPITKTYDVTFYDADDEVYETGTYAWGDTVSVPDIAPVKASDEQYDYDFMGWSDTKGATEPLDQLPAVNGNASYYPVFDANEKSYMVTFYDVDGEVFFEDSFAYGTKPYCEDNPTKESDDQYDYTFVGWSDVEGSEQPLNELPTVTGEAVYYPVFNSSDRTYTITWANYDGTTLLTEEYNYGTIPNYSGSDPERERTDSIIYQFDGWNQEIQPVMGNVTYTATFKEITVYTVNFYNDNGDLLETAEYAEGDMPRYTGEEPTKASDDQYDYTFAGFEPGIAEVTEDADYYATYNEILREYTITWQYEDGTVIKSEEVSYGTLPEYTGETPTKDSDQDNYYEFSGWTPEISEVTGDKTYTATFEAIPFNPTYTVTWVNWDNEVLETDDGMVTGMVPSYDGETPERIGDDGDYEFVGWSSDGGTTIYTDDDFPGVYDDVTYVAQFEFHEADPQSYLITWLNWDNTELGSDQLFEDEAISYSYQEPTKEGDDYGEFVFVGWMSQDGVTYTDEFPNCTSDMTFTAQFEYQPYTTVGVNFGNGAASTNGGDFEVYLDVDGDIEIVGDITLKIWTMDHPEQYQEFELGAWEGQQIQYFSRDGEDFIVDFVNGPVQYQLTYYIFDYLITSDIGSFEFTTEGSSTSTLSVVNFYSDYTIDEYYNFTIMVEFNEAPVDGDTFTLLLVSDEETIELHIRSINNGSDTTISASGYVQQILSGTYTVKLIYDNNSETLHTVESVTFVDNTEPTTSSFSININNPQSLGSESPYSFTCEVTSDEIELSSLEDVYLIITTSGGTSYSFTYPTTGDGGPQTFYLASAGGEEETIYNEFIAGACSISLEYIDPASGSQTFSLISDIYFN